MEQNLTYESAYQELAEIASEIESETVSIDVLAEKVKRASFLINYCKKRLKGTEEEIDKIITQMNS